MTDPVKEYKCLHCGKPAPYAHNFCTWECQIESWRASGAVEYCPNGLPIRCLQANPPMMLECAHGGHPDYIFPVTAKYLGPEDPEEGDETHALIYTDGCVVLTLHECLYYTWLLDNGEMLSTRYGETEKYRLSDESLEKVRAYAAKKVKA